MRSTRRSAPASGPRPAARLCVLRRDALEVAHREIAGGTRSTRTRSSPSS
jgi:hypothetical protein